MSKLDGKTAIITGATGAIGQSLCHALAGQGCRLGLLGRRPDTLAELAAALRKAGAEVAFQPAELCDRAVVAKAVAAIERSLAPADLLIHNAGVGRLTYACAPNVDDVEEMVQVNYLGGVYAMAAVLPGMLRRQSGHLVATSSLSALRGIAWTAGYSASKAAFATCLESLRPALRRRGILVSTCYLGFVRTPMSQALPLHPMLLMISPQRAAQGILRAILRGRSESYFPWYDALGARLLRRLPARAFDAVMCSIGRLMLRTEY